MLQLSVHILLGNLVLDVLKVHLRRRGASLLGACGCGWPSSVAVTRISDANNATSSLDLT